MIKKHPNSFVPEKKAGDHKWIPVLLLFLLMLLSSCAAGYILDRSAFPGSSGQRIDTILLTPDGTEGESAIQQIFHLTGKINYTNGRPYARGRVQLHSEPRETVTDAAGGFSFFHVEGGEHQVRILDPAGNVLGERSIDLFAAQADSGVNVSLKESGKYTIEVAVDVRMLEVVIELDEENSTLYIDPEKLTYLTEDGRIVTPTGEAHRREGTLVTPGGAVVSADGTVIAPASEGPLGIALLTPENEVVYPDQDQSLPDGTRIMENGNIILPGGTVIERNNSGTEILTPDGQRGQPGAGGVVISGDNQVSPIGSGTNAQGDPDESISGSIYDADGNGEKPEKREEHGEGNNGEMNGGGGSNGAASGDSSGGNNGNTSGDSGGGNNGNTNGGSSGSNGDTNGGSGGGNSGDTNGDGGNSGNTGDHEDEGPIPNFYVSWTQGQEIQLFSGPAGDDQTLLPGVEGSYPFKLENKNDFNVTCNLSIQEGSIHIPMRFRIVTEGDKKPLTGWWDTQKGSAVKSDTLRLGAGESHSYVLEWKWPYESGNDGIDTAAGEAGESFRVRLKISAQQEAP